MDNVLESNYMRSSMITISTLVAIYHTPQGAGITHTQIRGAYCNTPLVQLKTHIVILKIIKKWPFTIPLREQVLHIHRVGEHTVISPLLS